LIELPIPLSNIVPRSHVVRHFEATCPHCTVRVEAKLWRALEAFAINLTLLVLFEAQLALICKLSTARC